MTSEEFSNQFPERNQKILQLIYNRSLAENFYRYDFNSLSDWVLEKNIMHPEAKLGWIDHNGVFYGCGWCSHDRLIYMLGMSVGDVEEAGWVRIKQPGWWMSTKKINKQQKTTLRSKGEDASQPRYDHMGDAFKNPDKESIEYVEKKMVEK